jgi:hypothetical protein
VRSLGGRHGFKADAAYPGACGEKFGGVARCGLPMENAVHMPTDEPMGVEATGYTVRDTPMWERAVTALRTEGVGWHNGPYPFRKYVIEDEPGGDPRGLFEHCIKALLFVGSEFWVDCRRVEIEGEEQPRREVLVTYGRFASYSRDAIAVELTEENAG